VSRDRSGEYADAVKKAAPEAIQVADRFHLIKNLGDVVLRVFQRRSESLQSIPAPGPPRLQLTRLRLDREASRRQTRAQMRTLFRSIQALRRAGMNKSAIAIARFLGVHRHTVQKYSALESPPQENPAFARRAPLPPTKATSSSASRTDVTTRPRSTRRSRSKATPARTKTFGASSSI
jgi:hypothetical protein